MLIGHIPGYTRKLGESQGYEGLPVKDVIETSSSGHQYNAMQTLWHPTQEDIRNIINGGAILLTVLGTGHPPVRVDIVGPEAFDPFSSRAKLPETGSSAETAKEE